MMASSSPLWRSAQRATSSSAAAAQPLGAVYRFSQSHLPRHMPTKDKAKMTGQVVAVLSGKKKTTATVTAATSLENAEEKAKKEAEFASLRHMSEKRRDLQCDIKHRLPREPPATHSVAPELSAVPRLAHGLERVLRSPGVHLLRDPVSQQFNFDPYLSTIHQPDELDLSALPSFTPSSRDQQLKALAQQLNCRFLSSTSSISPIFALLVHLATHYRPLNLQMLSGPFASVTHQSTRITTQPIAFHVRPSAAGGYAVDSGSLDLDVMPDNLVLIDLGKSLEAMLTLERADFERLLLKKDTGAPPKQPPRDAFHYLKVGDMLLRAQLDCVDESLPGPNKVFDIKTRATFAVRRDCGNHRRHVGYRLSRLLGEFNSFEREFYDMARSAFLKYNMQVRIGRMNGIFVAYHNTRELFGFEYLSQQDLDECIFGSTALGDRVFNAVCQLTEQMLSRIVADSEHAAGGERVALRCVMAPDRNLSLVNLFVEQLTDDAGWRDQQWRKATERPATQHARRLASTAAYDALCASVKGPIVHYTLAINVFLNGKRVTDPFNYTDGDELDVDYGWQNRGTYTPQTVPTLFWNSLRMCK